MDVADPGGRASAARSAPGSSPTMLRRRPTVGLWITAGEASQIGVYARTLRIVPAGTAPQHVSFLGGRVFVTSGADGTVRVVDGPETRVPVGSYNVQFVGGRIVTPSLERRDALRFDARGRLLHRVRVASSSHDAA